MNIDTAYSTYTTLRLHFTTDNFDIRNGIKPKKPKNGVKTKMVQALQKLLRKAPTIEDFVGFLISNFLHGDMWGGLYSPEADEIFVDWKRKQESLTYMYTQELSTLAMYATQVEQLWQCDGGHPLILRAYCGKICSLETLVILNKLYRFIEKLDAQLDKDPVWSMTSSIVQKYSPFIKINKEKFSMITEKAFL